MVCYDIKNRIRRAFLVTEITAEMVKKMIPTFGETIHKGSRGKVLVIGGSKGMLGAAVLAAKSALRNGCGLVYLAVPAKYLSLINVANPEIIVIPIFGSYLKLVRENDYDAILIGPGLSKNWFKIRAAKQLILYLSAYRPGQKVVLDADGLLLLKGIYRKLNIDLVITPHMREMSRIVWRSVRKLKRDPYLYSELVSKKYPCTVVLKDHNTYITCSEHKLINTTGTSALARGGSGDVLSGIIVSFMAQGLPDCQAAAVGSFVHALCGRIAAERGAIDCVMPQDLIEVLPKVHRMLKGR